VHLVSRHALALSCNEEFRQMSWLSIAALLMVPFCRPSPTCSSLAPDAHWCECRTSPATANARKKKWAAHRMRRPSTTGY